LLVGVAIKNNRVCNFELAVDGAMEAGCIANTRKVYRWGIADWAIEGHGR
jgi:hypothetical protein